jgi:fimbrial isopeptide formation D2 family protein/LPXTG-motif cell wall-anchored protein
VFDNLDFGYYVITSEQGKKAISVDSTNPNATINDKNTTLPVNDLKKTVDDEDKVVSIGDEITYTVKFGTANYLGDNKITKYKVEDTLPAFLTNVKVTSVIVDNDGELTTTNDQTTISGKSFGSEKSFEIEWANENKSLYNNGATIYITYTATVTDEIQAGNIDANKNVVTVTPYAGGKYVTEEARTDDEKIKTYAAALQKVDEEGKNLAGAQFEVHGLTVSGSAGVYTVVTYDPDSASKGTVMDCDSEGFLVIRGLSDETEITIYEETAPDGYNKLTSGQTLPVTKTSEVTTITTLEEAKTVYYDADGKVVAEEVEGGSSTKVVTEVNDDLLVSKLVVTNAKGIEMPSTGGIGTTIFYIVGGVMVAGAVVFLLTKRRMGVEE